MEQAFLALLCAGENSIMQSQARDVLAYNAQSAPHGLSLTPAQAAALLQAERGALEQTGRLPLGPGVLPALIARFSASPFLNQADYPAALAELTEIFYALKTETEDALGDEALLAQMEAAFNGPCQGSTALLSDALPALIRKARADRKYDGPDAWEAAYDEP